MGEAFPPTQADYAWASASDALSRTKSLENRVEHLERYVARLVELIDSEVVKLSERVDQLEKRPTCCGGGDQWGHDITCPQCPD